MQGSLRGNGGPRYRHVVDEGAPYETITVDKVTPIIGAEIGGIDLADQGERAYDFAGTASSVLKEVK